MAAVVIKGYKERFIAEICIETVRQNQEAVVSAGEVQLMASNLCVLRAFPCSHSGRKEESSDLVILKCSKFTKEGEFSSSPMPSF